MPLIHYPIFYVVIRTAVLILFVVTGHIINKKITIIKYQVSDIDYKWSAVVEEWSCFVRLAWERRKETIKLYELYELFAYIFVGEKSYASRPILNYLMTMLINYFIVNIERLSSLQLLLQISFWIVQLRNIFCSETLED